MCKKIFTYIGIALIIILFGAYFYCASILERHGKDKIICDRIEISILDSTINRFVSKKDVADLVLYKDTNPVGKNPYAINLNHLEKHLERNSAIKKCDVSFDRTGKMQISVTQRRPILRMETVSGGFYADEFGYIFPTTRNFTSFVPIFTGNIPIHINKDYRGCLDGENKIFTDKIIKLAKYIDINEFWNAQVEQIDIHNNGDITLYTRIGDQKIHFGPMNDIEYKFAKLMSFYKEIVPVYGWEKYSEVNLKYSNQIVCTKRKTKNKKY